VRYTLGFLCLLEELYSTYTVKNSLNPLTFKSLQMQFAVNVYRL
jgi:hypothetical protein